jgi:CBS-domain-containing membrane protein
MTHAVTETVSEVMAERPVTVQPDALVAAVYRLMEERGIATCPVVSETGELCGMVSRVDLLRAFRPSRELRALSAEEIGRLPVRDVMRCGVVTVEPEDPMVAAVDLFADTRLHALPVVRRGAGRPVVVGIVTQGDALRHLMGATAPRR